VHCDPFSLNWNMLILASTSVPCRLTTAQMPKLALIDTKRITVWLGIAAVQKIY
jgi:hypothetical protein